MIKNKAMRRTVRNTAVLFVGGLMLIACAAEPTPAELEKHKAPLPAIKIYDGDGVQRTTIYRQCDGTTLLYVREIAGSGIAAIPNSPLCPAA